MHLRSINRKRPVRSPCSKDEDCAL
jgi:hypothetical protein